MALVHHFDVILINGILISAAERTVALNCRRLDGIDSDLAVILW